MEIYVNIIIKLIKQEKQEYQWILRILPEVIMFEINHIKSVTTGKNSLKDGYYNKLVKNI